MHRSGTSAISRGLKVMGVELGDRLMPPNEAVNAKGFWEDIDLNELNIEMLQVLGIEWYSLVPITPAAVETLCQKGYLLRAAELLRKKADGVPTFGFKDPRVAKLLPFWRQVFEHCHFDVRYVLAIRHPLSVAKSLEKRDGMEAEASYILWLEHVIASLEGTVDEKRVIVDYDLLMRSAERQLGRIADRLDLPIDPANLQEYKSGFLDESLRHSIYALNDLLVDKACPLLVREVYATLLGVASGDAEDDANLQDSVKFWACELARTVPILGLIDRLIGQKQAVLAEYERQLAAAQGRLEALAEQKEALNQKLAKSEYRVARLENTLSERGIQLEADYRVIAERDNQISRLSELIAKRDEQIAIFNVTLTERDMQIARLTDETVHRGEWALGLERQLKEVQARIAQLTTSNSWYTTLPLREMRRWVNAPVSQATRYLRGALRLGKAVYSRLPLRSGTRATMRLFVARHAPWILRASSGQPFSVQPSQAPLVMVPPVSELGTAAAGIEMATSAQPLVSIIIPVYGQCEYTIRCLLSIIANPPSIPYEVIVVDDHSPDDSFEVLHRVRGIHLIHNPHNQGFIRSCNIGAKAAKGQYVYFLNNDTQVTPGWLDELVRTFDEFPGTGLAGSKLVYPDGTLQEAGGIIWRDGSAWNFGRNQDPSLPLYNYAREVDYCSGASIMVPRELFNNLGGFDEHYLPAYCEDADLALKIRDLGCRVIYQPLSVVVHFEGVTSGIDTTKGVKAYQVENTKKLLARWHVRLMRHQENGNGVDQAKDRMASRRILVIDHCTPTPNQDSGSIDTYNVLLLLREMGFQPTFIPEDNFLYMHGYTAALQKRGVEVLYAPYITSVRQHLADCGERYDLVMLIRPGVAKRHMDAVRKFCPSAKVLFHTVDLHYLRLMREAALTSNRQQEETVEHMKSMELSLMKSADVTTVISQTELELISLELPEQKIRLLPYARDIRGTKKGFSDRKDIVFVGGYRHTPNIDAVKYFTAEIMPIIRSRLPDVRFHIVGSNPPPDILALSAIDVVVHGFVEDINLLFDQMRVSVAPLRFGAGIKGKIGSAMAVGLPVVATSIAAEGMFLTDGENILVADTPADFAEAVIRLYEDETLWSGLSRASIKFADMAWGSEAAWSTLASVLRELDISVQRDGRPLRLYSGNDVAVIGGTAP